MHPGWPITPVQKRSVATTFLFLVVMPSRGGKPLWQQSRAKTKKFEDSWAEQIEEWRVTTGQHLNPLWGPLPSSKPKIWTPHSRKPSPELLSLSRWILTPVKLSYSGTTKMNLFKMLDFQRIYFSKKRPWKRAISLLNQIVKISLLSQIIRFQVNAPFRDFLIVITNFFGTLKSRGRWLFMNNKSSFENILASGVVEASFWKIKGIFE